VAILNPEHLFAQAAALVRPSSGGQPRQIDLRRAISSAYYGIFHATLIAAADEVVGATKRSAPLYGLVYRSVDHRKLRDVCLEVRKPQPSTRYAPYVPAGGFGAAIAAYAVSVVELQEKRYSADYNPLVSVTLSDARLAIATARTAVDRFTTSSTAGRSAFLMLLLFAPR
jgi:hypothetical protein